MSDHRVEVKPRKDDSFGYVHLEITGDGIPPHSTGVLIPSGGPVCPSPEWQADQLARLIARVYAAGIAEGKRQVREALGLR